MVKNYSEFIIQKLYQVRIISDTKVFATSRALALSILRAKALLQTLIITIQPDIILKAISSLINSP
ncbi:hypothetical protein AFK68_11895 [Hydrocoleum sp. CS-953]|nr:hypothetical protein AFK68_21050 [Hydrocoleum sp. CS-953]OZH54286.1 hypothetical protein AFK68_11895 [Hydrocoleum sp. CS-953]